MNEQFQKYSLRIFDELNTEINNKISSLESNDIENSIKNLMKADDIFSEIESKLHKAINTMIISKLNIDIETQLNFIK